MTKTERNQKTIGEFIESAEDFFAWEKASKDTIDVKRIYVDITWLEEEERGDLVSGILLSQIVFWHLPGKKEEVGTKVKVVKDDQVWLVKKREDWWEECRITPKQFDRAIDRLQKANLIECKLFKFDGAPTVHLRLLVDTLTERVKWILTKGQNGNCPKGKIYGYSPKVKMEIDERSKSLTEITSESTKENIQRGEEEIFVSQISDEDGEQDTDQPAASLLKNQKFQELFIQEREKERRRREAAGIVLKEPRLASLEEKPQPKVDPPLTEDEAESIAEAEIVLRVKKIGLAGKESKIQLVAHALKQTKERGKSARAVVQAWGQIPEEVAVHADLERFYEALEMPLTSGFVDHNMKHVGSVVSDVMRNMSQGEKNGTKEAR